MLPVETQSEVVEGREHSSPLSQELSTTRQHNYWVFCKRKELSQKLPPLHRSPGLDW